MPKRDPKTPPFKSEDLEPIEFLQRGAWGFVWRYRQFSRAAGSVRHAPAALGYVAVKCVEVSEYARSTIQNAFAEARAQRRGAGNPHVVALYDVVVPEDDLIALVMEEVEGGRTLGDEISQAFHSHRGFSAENIIRWANEIAIGLQAFHAPGGRDGKQVAHRDIAPDNILLTPSLTVKLADMGIATVVGDSGLAPLDQTPAAGRVLRMAPEQYFGDGEWGTAVDYWALGLIVFELATHTPLEYFCSERVPEMTPSPEYSRAIGDAVRRQAGHHASMHPELRELIVGLLSVDPSCRAGLEQIEEARSRIASQHAPSRHHPSAPRTPIASASSVSISEEELADLRAALRAPSVDTDSREGSFERLVGRQRARRHRSEKSR
jgi:serine/threonine protein kinase